MRIVFLSCSLRNLEKTLESPLDCKEIQPVHSEGDQPWNSSTLATSREELMHWKRLWCWEGLGQEERGTTEDEMAGCRHWLDGHEFEWTLGFGDGQGGLACCSSWGRKESDMTDWLNCTDRLGGEECCGAESESTDGKPEPWLRGLGPGLKPSLSVSHCEPCSPSYCS